MFATVSSSSLVAALRTLAPFTVRKAKHAIWSTIRARIVGPELELFAGRFVDDGSANVHFARAFIPIIGESDAASSGPSAGAFRFCPFALADALKRIKCETVRLSDVALNVGPMRIETAGACEPDDLASPAGPDPIFEVSAVELADAMKRADFARDNSGTRYAFNAFYFVMRSAGSGRVCTCDGRRLAFAGLNAPALMSADEYNKPAGAGLVSESAFVFLGKLMSALGKKTAARACVRFNLGQCVDGVDVPSIFRVDVDGLGRFECGSVASGQFPPALDVVPQYGDESPTRVEASADGLADVVRIGGAAVNLADNPGAVFQFADGHLVISSAHGAADVSADTVSIGAAVDGPALRIGFNPQYVIEALEECAGQRVTLRCTVPNRPGRIDSADGSFVYVVMPVNIPAAVAESADEAEPAASAEPAPASSGPSADDEYAWKVQNFAHALGNGRPAVGLNGYTYAIELESGRPQIRRALGETSAVIVGFNGQRFETKADAMQWAIDNQKRTIEPEPVGQVAEPAPSASAEPATAAPGPSAELAEPKPVEDPSPSQCEPEPVGRPSIRPTRYPALGYEIHGRALWRIIDRSSGKPIGPHYPTRAELLADLDRFAAVFGCEGTAAPSASAEPETAAPGPSAELAEPVEAPSLSQCEPEPLAGIAHGPAVDMANVSDATIRALRRRLILAGWTIDPKTAAGHRISGPIHFETADFNIAGFYFYPHPAGLTSPGATRYHFRARLCEGSGFGGFLLDEMEVSQARGPGQALTADGWADLVYRKLEQFRADAFKRFGKPAPSWNAQSPAPSASAEPATAAPASSAAPKPVDVPAGVLAVVADLAEPLAVVADISGPSPAASAEPAPWPAIGYRSFSAVDSRNGQRVDVSQIVEVTADGPTAAGLPFVGQDVEAIAARLATMSGRRFVGLVVASPSPADVPAGSPYRLADTREAPSPSNQGAPFDVDDISADGPAVAESADEAEPVGQVADPARSAGPEQSSPASSSPRAETIARILAAARRPALPIVEVFELSGSDGKWYGANGFPHHVQYTGQRRLKGYAFNDRGVTVGRLMPTREALEQFADECQRERSAAFAAELEAMPADRFAGQVAYWLKDAAPAASSAEPGQSIRANDPSPETAPTSPSLAPALIAAAGQLLPAGVTLSHNAERDGLEFRFTGKPAESVRDALKHYGYRWSRFSACWYRRADADGLGKLRGLCRRLAALQLGRALANDAAEPVDAPAAGPAPADPADRFYQGVSAHVREIAENMPSLEERARVQYAGWQKFAAEPAPVLPSPSQARPIPAEYLAGLDSHSQWMVRCNLEYVAAEGLAPVVDRLKAHGYLSVAATVEAIAGKPGPVKAPEPATAAPGPSAELAEPKPVEAPSPSQCEPVGHVSEDPADIGRPVFVGPAILGRTLIGRRSVDSVELTIDGRPYVLNCWGVLCRVSILDNGRKFYQLQLDIESADVHALRDFLAESSALVPTRGGVERRYRYRLSAVGPNHAAIVAHESPSPAASSAGPVGQVAEPVREAPSPSNQAGLVTSAKPAARAGYMARDKSGGRSGLMPTISAALADILAKSNGRELAVDLCHDEGKGFFSTYWGNAGLWRGSRVEARDYIEAHKGEAPADQSKLIAQHEAGNVPVIGSGAKRAG